MSTEKKEGISTNECDRFSTELMKRIPDEYFRNLVSSTFAIVYPSNIKDIDPNTILVEANKLENEGKIGDAFLKYRVAAFTAFYKKLENGQTFWEAYTGFLSRNKNMAKWHSKDIDAYKEVSQNQDIMQILINTYGEFIRAPVEISKKKS